MNPRGLPKNGNAMVARLAERQMRNWEMARSQRWTSGSGAAQSVEDFITVSRVMGAGGSEVAWRLSERLGWPLFDREVLRLMAGDDRLREQIYTSLDERDLGWLEEAFRSIMQTEFVKNDYFHQLTRTICALARQGRCIFLGRAADLILPRSQGLRVRIVSPRALRIRRVSERHQVSPAQAEAEMDRVERLRSEFIERHFRVDAAEHTRHDLIINMQWLQVEQAVDLILCAVRLRGMTPLTAPSTA